MVLAHKEQIEEASVKGTVERILYSKGIWGLVLLKKGSKEIKAMGSILPLNTQSEVVLFGRWEEDKRNPGEQVFQATRVEIEQLTTRKGLIEKLSELPNIGKQRASVLVDFFGDDPEKMLSILQKDPELVAARIPGITKTRAKLIAQEIASTNWGKNLTRDVKLFQYLPRWIVDKSLKRWPGYPESKESALEVLFENPYRLMELMDVGFKRADAAALKTGIEVNDNRRVDAALQFLLLQAAQSDGHTWISLQQMGAWAAKEQILGIARKQVEEACWRALATKTIHADPSLEKISSASLWAAERTISSVAKSKSKDLGIDNIIDPRSINPSLNDEQALAVELAQRYRFLILTGGPGTGKTYTLKAILSALEKKIDHFGNMEDVFALCAPTGKAAMRMQEMTGHVAKTVHRTLGYNPDKGFTFGGGELLPHCVVVCDESSMLDADLAAQLFSALNDSSSLILVGDVDQLPSVGAGNVLGDLINSGSVPVVRLQQVMRQADDSAIVTNAHALIKGENIQIDNDRFVDFKFFEIEESEIKREERLETQKVIFWAYDQLRQQLGYKEDEIQILSPQKGAEIGTVEINRLLRHKVNPPLPSKKEIKVPYQERILREGDRVIQTRNDYDIHVMNGQIGRILKIEDPDPLQSNDRGAVLVAMEDEGGRIVRYPATALQSLFLGYAITVHKSQGSEWPAVIIPVSTSHAKTLTRRLLYTAITRAKDIVILVGTKKALRHAKKNIGDAKRQTRLISLLTKKGVSSL